MTLHILPWLYWFFSIIKNLFGRFGNHKQTQMIKKKRRKKIYTKTINRLYDSKHDTEETWGQFVIIDP